jgi:transposase-like protein
MAKPKIDPDLLRQFLDAGHTQAEAARHFGVTEPAIYQRVKQMQRLTSQVVALEKAGTLVDQKLTATDRLARVQQIIDDELAWAVHKAQEPEVDRSTLVDMILRLAGEVRQQLGLQLSISRALVDLRVVKEFQDTVIDIIRQENPDTAHRIIARLKERRALRPSAELPTLDGGGPDGLVA